MESPSALFLVNRSTDPRLCKISSAPRGFPTAILHEVGQALPARVARSNAIADLVLSLLEWRCKSWGTGVVENPWTSWLWYFPQSTYLAALPSVYCTRVWGCCHGMDKSKRWCFMHNCGSLHKLLHQDSRCPGHPWVTPYEVHSVEGNPRFCTSEGWLAASDPAAGKAERRLPPPQRPETHRKDAGRNLCQPVPSACQLQPNSKPWAPCPCLPRCSSFSGAASPCCPVSIVWLMSGRHHLRHAFFGDPAFRGSAQASEQVIAVIPAPATRRDGKMKISRQTGSWYQKGQIR